MQGQLQNGVQATPEMRELLAEIALACSLGLSNDTALTIWPAARGRACDGTLMVIGRAGNGGATNFCAKPGADDSQPVTDAAAARALTDTLFGSETCPLSWVVDQAGDTDKDGYNTNKSAFWRIARRVLAELTASGEDWSSHLAWSNLYKVAPWEGGNPGAKLMDYQWGLAARLLRAELDLFQPRHILFVTGGYETWFLPFLQVQSAGVSGDYLHDCGTLRHQGGAAAYAVIDRPETRSDDKIVAAALHGFNSARP
ncbi:MAG: hypothetical protein AAFR17_08330 [Pseudomonadota bacterium]